MFWLLTSAPCGVLLQYCKDLTEEAAAGRLSQALGRDKEMVELINTLNRCGHVTRMPECC